MASLSTYKSTFQPAVKAVNLWVLIGRYRTAKCFRQERVIILAAENVNDKTGFHADESDRNNHWYQLLMLQDAYNRSCWNIEKRMNDCSALRCQKHFLHGSPSHMVQITIFGL